MKKILILIPFLFLFACGGGRDGQSYNTLHLDSQKNNTYTYSVLLKKASLPKNVKDMQRLLEPQMLKAFKQLKASGHAYVKLGLAYPDTQEDFKKLVNDGSKDLKFSFIINAYKTHMESSHTIDDIIVLLEDDISKH